MAMSLRQLLALSLGIFLLLAALAMALPEDKTLRPHMSRGYYPVPTSSPFIQPRVNLIP